MPEKVAHDSAESPGEKPDPIRYIADDLRDRISPYIVGCYDNVPSEKGCSNGKEQDSCLFAVAHGNFSLMRRMVQVTGFEPAFSAWQADVLSIVTTPGWRGGDTPVTPVSHGIVPGLPAYCGHESASSARICP